MAENEPLLSIHPRTGIRALGMTRRGPVWPCVGAADPDPEPDPTPDPEPDPTPDPDPQDKGFPANTPVAEMTAKQQAAYWQHQSRKHEARVKALGGVTPEKLKELRDKADKHDALEAELASDSERAAREAKENAEKAANDTYRPKLVRAEFKAAAAGRIDSERLDTILEPLDLNKFLTADGEVDADKVSKFVDDVAPDKESDDKTRRRGPSPSGTGRRQGSSASTGQSVASGRDLYRERFARDKSAATT